MLYFDFVSFCFVSFDGTELKFLVCENGLPCKND